MGLRDWEREGKAVCRMDKVHVYPRAYPFVCIPVDYPADLSAGVQ